MENRFKFRAWDGHNIISPPQFTIGAGSSAEIIEISLDGRISLRNAYGLDVIGDRNPAFDESAVGIIIQQFSGLKDKLGNDIYEGDILDNGTGEYKGEVTFSNGSFLHRDSPLGYFVEDGVIEDNRFDNDNDKITLQVAGPEHWAIVIGNSIQHPHLLTDKKS